jgi:hypothetical protein
MKRISLRTIACSALLSFAMSVPAFATNGTATGTIQHIFTYGDGMVLMTGFNFPGATCSNNGGFVIPATHPQFSRLLAVLLSAKAAGSTIEVVAKIDTCWYPTLTETADTYLHVLP